MKKFLTLKNILLCSAALLALAAFILSFLVDVNFVTQGGDGARFFKFIWGPKRLAEFGEGEFHEADIPAALLPMPTATLPLVGALLVLIGTVAAVVVGLLVKKPFAKWIVLGCGALAVLGGVFFFFFKAGALAQFGKMMDITAEQAKQFLEAAGAKIKSAGAVVAGILGILAGGACAASALLPEKK